ncbi:sensor histidine kinase [Trueperella bialowiezensis]|uniref:histidine kinase n=1 Tax=Trueperella bialowiezensis TaxID=312285 RepID=A0A3S5EVZ6_9ACTO|nr:ATP-binding protein [Trueperella bialowiezensis]VEI12791.1 Cell-division control histidine kinase pdhS [Trueperella bialowiezensis]
MVVAFTCLTLVCGALAIACVYLWRERRRARATAPAPAETQPLAIISHELRTPLALIRGAGELLAEESPGKLNRQQREFVSTIVTNSQLAIDIAENLVSDLRLSTTHIAVSRVDVRQIIARAVRDMRRFTDVNIEVDAPGGLLPIYADPQLIHQLVWNLVNNAVRHAGPDARIRVRVANGEAGGLHLRISDDGRGMSTEELEQLFVPFVSGSARRPGAGIGMMISKRIVDAHSGQIIVDSEIGRGTTIHVVLPHAPSERTLLDSGHG